MCDDGDHNATWRSRMKFVIATRIDERLANRMHPPDDTNKDTLNAYLCYLLQLGSTAVAWHYS